MTVALVPAGPQDAPVLAALYGATVGAEDETAGEGWSAAWLARILALPGAFAVLALAPEPVGFALCLPAGEAVDLVAIGVLPAQRRSGCGIALLENCAARARSAGAHRLLLEVADDNAAAIALYRRAGFVEAGRRPQYYRHRKDGVARDALVFSKTM
ncbi:MAG: GNAT family N-acetyltransferase [Rhodospirillaceae bacterium]|nr:GNAT family N-acetyltransferase [Rhodospirillaceae bacterium]